jgi:hypothetical protein
MRERIGALFPKVQLCCGHPLLLVGRVLGAIQLDDEVEHLLSHGRRRQCLVEVATHAALVASRHGATSTITVSSARCGSGNLGAAPGAASMKRRSFRRAVGVR